eukprot:1010986-Prymnesium_polylepis.1
MLVCVPSGHDIETADPSGQNFPLSQATGSTVPLSLHCLPAGQSPAHKELCWCSTALEPNIPGAHMKGNGWSSFPSGSLYAGFPSRAGEVAQSQGWVKVLVVHCLPPIDGGTFHPSRVILSGSSLHCSKMARHSGSGWMPILGQPSRYTSQRPLGSQCPGGAGSS